MENDMWSDVLKERCEDECMCDFQVNEMGTRHEVHVTTVVVNEGCTPTLGG